MSFHFGLGGGHLPLDAARIAERHGAALVNHTDPQCQCGHGCGLCECPKSRRHWFSAPNHGEPHNSRIASAVLAELASAGLIEQRAEVAR